MTRHSSQLQDHRFSAFNLIEKKQSGQSLQPEEINWVINSLMRKELPDYQMVALLMAIYFRGMSRSETAALTDAMLYSGKTLQFDDPQVVDKHSTGGVGDKTSFIVAPLAAACGVKVPMVAGRGLGHTGGTVDKIESIPGFKTSMSLQQFAQQLKQHGLVLTGQTNEIAPADRQIYALRDVTATINSIPLITASIMSKKLAEGAMGLVMDIKVGNGAFLQTKAEARKLANSIIYTAKRFDRKAICHITDMNQPLGHAIGNSLEIIECVQTLKNQGPKDLTVLSLELAASMVELAGIEKTHAKALKRVKQALSDGTALEKFRQLVLRQGGDIKMIDHPELIPLAPQYIIKSPQTGYIKTIQTKQLGLLCVELGGGRRRASDNLDHSVGLILHKKRGDRIRKGEPLISLYSHHQKENWLNSIENQICRQIIKIGNRPNSKPKILYETLM